MNAADKRKAFFHEHIKDRVQDEYNLSDEDFSGLLKFLSDFDDDSESLLRSMSRPKSKDHLRKIVTELYGEKAHDDSYKDFQLSPVTAPDALSYPMGIPLSKDMIIEPHT